MKGTIIRLKSHHNSLSLIARLPPEVLSTVFGWLPTMTGKCTGTPWIRVSFVCKDWREIALGCPELWSFVKPGMGSTYLSTVIPRSREFPLTVSDWGDRFASPGMENPIRKQMHRIRDLQFAHHCHGTPDCTIHGLISQLTVATPSLESLELKACAESVKVEYLPDRAFSTSRIRNIHLSGWMLPATAATLGSLTQLTLESLDKQDGPELPQLLGLLQLTPNLENLVLRNAFRRTRHHPLEVLHLPHLQMLKIEHDTSTSIFNAYLHIDHLATTWVRLSVHPSQYIQFNELNKYLSKLGASVSDRLVIRHASISLNTCLIIRLGDIAAHNTIKLPIHGGCLQEDYITFFLRGLQLDHLQSLMVDNLSLSLQIWRQTFGSLKFLSTVHIRHADLNLVRALVGDLRSTATVRPYRRDAFAFRALHTLVLHEWDLTKATIEILESHLQFRAMQGATLKRLHIVGARWIENSPALALESLIAWVQRIEIDGVKFTDTDEENTVGNQCSKKDEDSDREGSEYMPA
ncbi:hypothetical protein DXG01_002159 [Tephrocybe rancida]|nr:hypothetical protein DXG01_002159 [Tephrocybe rancida]